MVAACIAWRVKNNIEIEGAHPFIDKNKPNYERAEFAAVVRVVEELGPLGRYNHMH